MAVIDDVSGVKLLTPSRFEESAKINELMNHTKDLDPPMTASGHQADVHFRAKTLTSLGKQHFDQIWTGRRKSACHFEIELFHCAHLSAWYTQTLGQSNEINVGSA